MIVLENRKTIMFSKLCSQCVIARDIFEEILSNLRFSNKAEPLSRDNQEHG